MAATLLGQAGGVPSLTSPEVDVSAVFLDAPLVEYQEASSTGRMADIPRFGHSSNLPDLFLEGDTDAQADYAEGLLFVGLFILVFFLIWTLLLLVFKYCCRKRLGFLSGRAFVVNDLDSKGQGLGRRAGRARVVFLIAGCILIVFSILLVVNGFQKIEDTRATADLSLDDIRLLIDDASVLNEDLKDVGSAAIDLRDQLVVELGKDNLCPNDENYLIQDAVGQTINEHASEVIEMLTQLGDFVTNDLKDLDDGLNNANAAVNDMDTVLETVAEKQWIGVIYCLPLVFVTALMMAGTMAAQGHILNDCSHLFLSWLVQPFFVLWIILSYIFCAGLALSATLNADFCSGGPDQTPDSTILLSLENSGIDQSGMYFEIARYYVRQCSAEAKVDPYLFLREHAAEIVSSG
jgi:hypothetical protein